MLYIYLIFGDSGTVPEPGKSIAFPRKSPRKKVSQFIDSDVDIISKALRTA
jgi:hypothetical protein